MSDKETQEKERGDTQKIPKLKETSLCFPPFFKKQLIFVFKQWGQQSGRILFASFRVLFPGHGETVSKYVPQISIHRSNTGSAAVLST